MWSGSAKGAGRAVGRRGAAMLIAASLTMLGSWPVAHAAAKTLDLAIVNGAVSYGSDNTLQVSQGDAVTLRWTSDRPLELHLHGYDIAAKVAPQVPAVMSFKADIPGRFPVELHGQGKGRHAALLYVEVRP